MKSNGIIAQNPINSIRSMMNVSITDPFNSIQFLKEDACALIQD